MKYTQYALKSFVAAALMLLSAQATAYQQNHTCDHSGRRACEAGETPQPIAWDRSCVLFYVDEAGSEDFPAADDGKASSELESMIEQAFDQWTQESCSGLQLIYGGMIDPDRDEIPGERRNVVSFETKEWPTTSAATFATTIVNYHPVTGAIREADINVNDQFYTFSSTDAPGPGEADLLNTLVHEVGHFIGLGHSDEVEATMFGSAGLGEIKKRTLHRDDVDGLCNQYPVSQFDSTCGHYDSDHPIESEEARDGVSWGQDDEEPPYNQAGCAVMPAAPLGIIHPIAPLLGLFGGLWCWRRRRRCSDG